MCDACGAAGAWRCIRRLTGERPALCLCCLRAERASLRARIEAWFMAEKNRIAAEASRKAA